MRLKTMRKFRQLKAKDIKPLRKHILRRQKGVCPICKRAVIRPCLDHHHKKRVKGTGLIRGVLCSNCNVFIAKSENNSVRYGFSNKELPVILRNMADYLEKKQYPYLHPSEKPKALKLGKSGFNKLKKLHDEKYPKRKPLEFPKSNKMTVPLQKLFKEFNIEPNFRK